MDTKTYILVWVDEDERWYYFIDDFFEGIFDEGYVSYEVDVADGVIIKDELAEENVGEIFEETYDLYLWE